jgi:hypothetical protein
LGQIRRNRINLTKIPTAGILNQDDPDWDIDIPDADSVVAHIAPVNDMPPTAEGFQLNQEVNGAAAPQQQTQNLVGLPLQQEPAGLNPRTL